MLYIDYFPGSVYAVVNRGGTYYNIAYDHDGNGNYITLSPFNGIVDSFFAEQAMANFFAIQDFYSYHLFDMYGFLPYKDIKYYEVDSHETRGVIYGYGVRRILIAIGKGIDEIYLITPSNEEKFIELLEKKINMTKRNTR